MKTQKTKWLFDGGHVELSVGLSLNGEHALCFVWNAKLSAERACRNTAMGEHLIAETVCSGGSSGRAASAVEARAACEKAATELRDAYLAARTAHLKQCEHIESLACSLEGEWPVDISRDAVAKAAVDISSD